MVGPKSSRTYALTRRGRDASATPAQEKKKKSHEDTVGMAICKPRKETSREENLLTP